jgi:hypothetical protein
MKSAIRLGFLVCALAVFLSGGLPPHATLHASGGCLCWTDSNIDAYRYGPPDVYLASFQDDTNLGTKSSNVDCATSCQSWVNGEGHNVCSIEGIVGTGYVIEHWKWYYGDGPQSGHLDQQYDCRDI